MAIEEKGLDYESRYVRLEAGEAKTSEFLEINPQGVVPVLIHEGHTVTESTIITEYLDDAFPSPPLMPRNPYYRARRRYWARRIDDEMHVPHIATISGVIAFNKAFQAGFDTQEKLQAYLAKIPIASHRATMTTIFDEQASQEALRTSLLAYDDFLEEMEGALSENQWLAGDDFSLAEIDVVPYVWRLKNLRLDFMWEKLPHLADWLDRVSARPSFKTAVIDTAIPEWLDLMASSGQEARAGIMRLLGYEHA